MMSIISYFVLEEFFENMEHDKKIIKNNKICFDLKPINQNLFCFYSNNFIPLTHLGPCNPYVINKPLPISLQQKQILIPIQEDEIAFVFKKDELKRIDNEFNMNIGLYFNIKNNHEEDTITFLLEKYNKQI